MLLVETMIELIRSAIFDRTPAITKGELIDWDELMDIALSQDLVALVWDGMCKLPDEDKPSRNQLINWGLSAQETHHSYLSQGKVLRRILTTCEENNMRLLLLKGFGLSSLYPHPESRSCSDIDIYLFDDYKKGNQIWGSHLISDIGKHSTLNIDGVIIENHNNFLEPNTKQKRKIISYIYSSLDKVVLTEEGYYVLEPLANLLFLTFHTLKHFHGGTKIPIRNIIDLALFIRKNEDCLPPAQCNQLFQQLHLDKSFELLLNLSEWILDIDLDKYHSVRLPSSELNEIKKELLIVQSHDVGHRGIRYKNKQESKSVLSKYIPRNVSYRSMFRSWLKQMYDTVMMQLSAG